MVVVLIAALVLLGFGTAVGRLSATNAGNGSSQQNAPAAPPLTPAAALPTVASPTPSDSPSPSPSPTVSVPPGRPTTPDAALLLTDQQALDELALEASESAAGIPALQGTWVPQVSSKCVGIPVDIGPNWIPDGVDDTPHISIQQILAFHLALHARVTAVTVLPTQLGIPTDRATGGPCNGQIVWMSIVPQTFSNGADANAWCAANVPPVRECLARYVARPGERSQSLLRQ